MRTEPALRHLVGMRFVLDEDYAVFLVDGSIVTVRRGYVYDVASVPRALWPFISPFDLSSSGALLHDFLYSVAGRPGEACAPRRVFSRLDSDRAFYDIMRARGVSLWRRAAGYLAVRTAGWHAWEAHERRLKGAFAFAPPVDEMPPAIGRLWLWWVMRRT